MSFTTRQERAARVIVALPADDWSPADWDLFDAARAVLRDELGRMDRRLASTPRRTVSGGAGYRKAREAVRDAAGGVCEARCDGCTGSGHHAHHIRRRSQGGQDTVTNLLWVCRSCHDWIHANPAASYELGYLHRGGVS